MADQVVDRKRVAVLRADMAGVEWGQAGEVLPYAANVPEVRTEGEVAGAVKCKLGVHTPLIHPGGVEKCVHCGDTIPSSTIHAALYGKIKQEINRERMRAINALVPTVEEMKKAGLHVDESVPMLFPPGFVHEMNAYDWNGGTFTTSDLNRTYNHVAFGGAYGRDAE